MILRKPYAILIKFFKFIHIILFLISIYLMYKFQVMHDFFRSFVKTNVYTHVENIADVYIGAEMFIVVGIVLASTIAIFYLMRTKEKPVLFYRIFIAYGILSLIILIVYTNFFNSLESVSYDRLTLSVYRDIIGVVHYISYIFIVFTFVRGFGFDIKKFSFEKDLKDLNITEEDSEEFEVSFAFDKEKLIESLRREIRLSKYYFKENALTLLIIGGITLIVGGVIIYRSVIVTNIVYSEGDAIVANNLEYKVLNSYVTNSDKYNVDLTENFLIVDFSVTNKMNSVQQIDLSRTRVVSGDQVYHPVVNRYDVFSDLGMGYNKHKLVTNVLENYILVFKLNSKFNVKNDLILEVFDHENNNNNKLEIIYKKIKLNKKYFQNSNEGTYKLEENIDFSKSILEKGSINISKYEISNKFIHEYDECVLEDCKVYKKPVSSSNNKKVMKLTISTEDLDISNIITYLSLDYMINEDAYSINAKNLKNLYNDENNLFIEVPYELESATEINLKFNIRGSLYNLNLLESK